MVGDGFRHFLILQTGLNSSNNDCMFIGTHPFSPFLCSSLLPTLSSSYCPSASSFLPSFVCSFVCLINSFFPFFIYPLCPSFLFFSPLSFLSLSFALNIILSLHSFVIFIATHYFLSYLISYFIIFLFFIRFVGGIELYGTLIEEEDYDT